MNLVMMLKYTFKNMMYLKGNHYFLQAKQKCYVATTFILLK